MDPNELQVYESPFPKARLGKVNDGGYIIAIIPNIKYDIFLSGGILDDISFEEDFCTMYPKTKCFAYDGTIDSIEIANPNIQFIKQNIAQSNTSKTTNFHDFLNINSNVFIKMDIEGGEVEWINSLSDFHLSSIAQIIIEFHFPFTEKEKDIFNKLNQHHNLIHFHANNCCGTRIYKDCVIPNVFECTYLHSKYFEKSPKLNCDKIPSNLDMRNVLENDEIFIEHKPFVHIEPSVFEIYWNYIVGWFKFY